MIFLLSLSFSVLHLSFYLSTHTDTCYGSPPLNPLQGCTWGESGMDSQVWACACSSWQLSTFCQTQSLTAASAFYLAGNTNLCNSSLPGLQFQQPVLRLQPFCQIKLKLSNASRSQLEIRELVSDPISLVFLGNNFGKVAVLKANDYSIEKDTVLSVIQDSKIQDTK